MSSASTIRSRRTRSHLKTQVTVSPGDLEIFKLLSRYRFLRKHTIDAFMRGNAFARQARMGGLYRAHYVDRPNQQWDFFNSNYRPAIYELDKRGEDELARRGLTQEPMAVYKHLHNEFAHNVMLCDVLANLELGARAQGAALVPYCGAVKLPVSISYTWKDSGIIRTSKDPYNPDAAFSIVYPSGKHLNFMLEVDTGSEPIERTGDLTASSYLKKMLQIEQVIMTGRFQDLGFNQVFFLHVTNSETRRTHIMQDICGPSKSNLFNVHPVLGDYRVDHGRFVSCEPVPDGKLFGKWLCEGHPDFDFQN